MVSRHQGLAVPGVAGALSTEVPQSRDFSGTTSVPPRQCSSQVNVAYKMIGQTYMNAEPTCINVVLYRKSRIVDAGHWISVVASPFVSALDVPPSTLMAVGPPPRQNADRLWNVDKVGFREITQSRLPSKKLASVIAASIPDDCHMCHLSAPRRGSKDCFGDISWKIDVFSCGIDDDIPAHEINPSYCYLDDSLLSLSVAICSINVKLLAERSLQAGLAIRELFGSSFKIFNDCVYGFVTTEPGDDNSWGWLYSPTSVKPYRWDLEAEELAWRRSMSSGAVSRGIYWGNAWGSGMVSDAELLIAKWNSIVSSGSSSPAEESVKEPVIADRLEGGGVYATITPDVFDSIPGGPSYEEMCRTRHRVRGMLIDGSCGIIIPHV